MNKNIYLLISVLKRGHKWLKLHYVTIIHNLAIKFSLNEEPYCKKLELLEVQFNWIKNNIDSQTQKYLMNTMYFM